MDELDLAILRETSRGRVMWWGSSDPRLSLRDVARRLGVDPSTVWSRLRAWQRCGFLVGFSVVPNPRLFSAHLAGGAIRVEGLSAKPKVLEDLALIEGSAFAVDQVGSWIVWMFVYDSAASRERCTRLARRLRGVAEVEKCVPFRSPETSREPGRTDWRILQSLHDHPRGSIALCAAAAGLSRRTFARRYDALVRDQAVWSIPVLDFTHYQGASIARVLIWVGAEGDVDRIRSSVERLCPTQFGLEDQSGLVEVSPEPPKLLSVFLQLSSVGEVEDVERKVRAIAGVGEVEVFFPRRLHVYDAWFTEHLRRRAT